ncbi:MAG: hypothetical protein LBL65_01095 [Campylobacteraceae bacterium]|jgi:hypothetical protein|nr:hypothetical protein [Campylobacteraceae bacterium]
MNSSRRFFTKTVLSLTALLFLSGCNSGETQASADVNTDLEIVEYDNFKIEYDRKNLVANFILKSNQNVTIISTHDENGVTKFTTREGETIIVLAPGHNEYKSPSLIGFGKDAEGNSLIGLFPAE